MEKTQVESKADTPSVELAGSVGFGPTGQLTPATRLAGGRTSPLCELPIVTPSEGQGLNPWLASEAHSSPSENLSATEASGIETRVSDSDKSIRALKREVRQLRRDFKLLTLEVAAYLARLDAVMAKPPTPERGGEIAQLSNSLEMANDRAWHFGLGLSLSGKKESR